MLGHMKKFTRTLLVGISALVALGTLSACSGGSSNQATSSSGSPTTPAAAFPQSARYIADMTAADGKTMTIGISVDGDEVAAYACNGTDDEAWFFGNQTDGSIDIKSRFRDTLQAEFDGGNVDGELNMNGLAYQFTAKPVTGDAGMYTADLDGVRASWVVREDGSAIGVQLTLSPSSTRSMCSSSMTRSSAPSAQQAATSAGPTDRAAVQWPHELQDQWQGCDPDSGQREFPSRLKLKSLTTQRPCRCAPHIGRAHIVASSRWRPGAELGADPSLLSPMHMQLVHVAEHELAQAIPEVKLVGYTRLPAHDQMLSS